MNLQVIRHGEHRGRSILIAVSLLVWLCPQTAAGAGTVTANCPPAKTPACDCSDVNDLINRWNVDNAAIGELKNQIAGMKAKEAKDGEPFMFDGDIYHDKLEPIVSSTAKKVSSPAANSAKGDTDAACNSTIDSPNSYCLCTIVKIHEAYHAHDCEQSQIKMVGTDKTMIGPGFSDYRNRRRMTEVANDEILGYQKEIDEINKILRGMPAKCRPKQWTGIVNYSETMQTASSTPIPPYSKILGGTNSGSFNRTFTITISVINGEPFANVDLTEVSKTGQEVTGMIKCHVNEQERAFTSHNNSTVTNEVHGYAKAPYFKVNFTGDSYRVSFRGPLVTGAYNQTRDVSPPACGPAFTPMPGNGSLQAGGTSYSAYGKGRESDNAISGSKTETHQYKDGSSTLTYSWNLFRSDASPPAVAETRRPGDGLTSSGRSKPDWRRGP